MRDRIFRDFLLGIIKIHVLHHAASEKIFGQEFRKELARHGYDISYGTLYPIFHKLERDGFLKSRKENVLGKLRKYYTITARGKAVLAEAKKKARELFDELHEND